MLRPFAAICLCLSLAGTALAQQVIMASINVENGASAPPELAQALDLLCTNGMANNLPGPVKAEARRLTDALIEFNRSRVVLAPSPPPRSL